MTWPTPEDYQDAVQNPQTAFSDLELKLGRAELDPLLRLPKPRSGNFATVYKLDCASRSWAVRFFNREFKDQQQRYNLICHELRRLKLQYTVEFEFLPSGIRIRNAWYPALKMEWIQGESLAKFVGRNLGRPVLNDLSDKLLAMSKRLAATGVAHGDLQHENILVCNGELRLIDYDGMYIPGLAGWKSHECGHPNYQHPKRCETDFGPSIDHFSVWAICLSLRALAADGSLWTRHNGGDECLLLRRQDFREPNRSSIFSDLTSSPDPHVKALALRFRQFLSLPPLQFPSLDHCASTQPVGPPARTSLDWLDDHAPRQKTPSTAGRDSKTNDIRWIFEGSDIWNPTSTVIQFQNDVIADRVVAVQSAIMVACVFVAALFSQITLDVAAIMLVTVAAGFYSFIRFRFNRDRANAEVTALRRDFPRISGEIASAWEKVQHANAELARLRNQFDQREADLCRRLTSSRSTEPLEIAVLQQRRATERLRIQSARGSAQQVHDAEMLRLRQAATCLIADLDSQIAALPQLEAKTLSAALQGKQQDHVANELRRFSVFHAQIPQQLLFYRLRQNLCDAGFRTAFDISPSVSRVFEIGPTRRRALLNWRASIEAQARNTMPTALPFAEQQAIRNTFVTRRNSLTSQRKMAEATQIADESRLAASHSKQMADLDAEEKAVERDVDAQISALRSRCSAEVRVLEEQLALLAKERQNSRPLANAQTLVDEAQKQHKASVWHETMTRLQLDAGSRAITIQQYLRRLVPV